MEARFSVAQFNEMINLTLQAVGDVVVEGEITQLNISAKGGVNIVIKDAKASAVLNISGYAPRIEGIKFVKEGMQVAAWGVPSLWSMGGRFSLQIFKILPLGEGALKEAYEQLKQQLLQEGLFAIERKRELPEIVTKIALLTGKDSAAQSDFYKILREHNFGAEIDYYPVQVQGKYAEQEIISALKHISNKDYDCVVLTRGGGSLEDLITFNSERLARTIFAMKIPVLVGIGHEKDESIADYVADVRAATPSQAAYYLVSHNQEFINSQVEKTVIMKSNLQNRLLSYTYTLERRRGFILQALKNLLQQWQYQLSKKTSGMSQKLLFKIQQVRIKNQKLEFQIKRIPQLLDQYSIKLQSLERLFASYNPKNVIKRGYAIVSNESGGIISEVEDVRIGENISILVKNGKIISNITKTINE